MSSLELSCHWLSGGGDADVDRVALADLTIRANGATLTESEDLFAMTVRESARLSAYPLALWVASNWWRLRWEPWRNTLDWRLSHCMASAGGGYAWPDVCFSSDGGRMRIESQAVYSREMSVRYLCDRTEAISAGDFEAGMDSFVGTVLARVSAFGGANDLSAIWQEVMAERADPQMSAWRKLEALMGCDPDDADDVLMDALGELSRTYGVGSIEELAAHGERHTPLVVEQLLSRATGTEKATIYKWPTLKAQLPERNDQRPWHQAREAASIAREAWGLDATEPITNEALSDLLSVRLAYIENGDSYALPGVGVRLDDAGGFEPVLSKRHASARRFELARLAGDSLLADPTDKLWPATNSKTVRQKFQRAFAQELLCPYDALVSFFGGVEMEDEAIEEAAQKYCVSPLLVKTTLVNHGHLDREELTMDLVE